METTRGGQQLELRFRAWGGKRKNAGRKPANGLVAGLSHRTRPVHREWTPVHVTMRAVAGMPSLRSQVVFAVVEREVRGGSRKGLRILHFSVQRDHVHMILEAEDATALARGVQRFASRVAMAANAVTRRHGKVWRERYHREDLTTPTQVRNAYVYVLMNHRKHAIQAGSFTEHTFAELDARSSARWFTGWDPRAGPAPGTSASTQTPPPDPPVAAPRSWLAATGWQKLGLLRPDEIPRANVRRERKH